jgi:hypothetical protein
MVTIMNMFWRVLVLHLNLLRTFRSVSATVARFLNLYPFSFGVIGG